MERLDRFAEWLSNAAMWVAVVITALMMLHVTADVAARNILNAPLFGTIEIVSAYYMVAVSYLPLAWIVKNEGHIYVELFTRNLSPRILFRIDTYVAIITLVYVSIITWKTLESALQQTAIREHWESAWGFIAVWPSRWFVVIGFGCFAIQVFAQVVSGLHRIRKEAGSANA